MKNNNMKKTLLASVAMVMTIGCTAAVAQEGSQGTGAGSSPGSAQHRLSPGGTSGAGGAMRDNQASPGGSAARNQAIPEKQGMGPPEGTSQNRERSSSTRQRGAEENSKTTQRGAQENNMQRGAEENNETNMQRSPKGNNGANNQRGAEENGSTNMQRGAKGNHRSNMQRGMESERGGATRENRENNARIQERERGGRAGSAGGRSVQLSERQRTQIKGLIVKDPNVPRANSSNFSVAVGSAVPREVHVAPLPPDVIRVVPEYRGLDYVVVRGQLLIIDPDTMKVIAILPA